MRIYQVSRSIYRRLAPYVTEDPVTDLGERNRRRVLDACEGTMRRLETEPDFARPDRFLFEEIRTCFPIGEQLWVRRVIDFYVAAARELLRQMPPAEQRECAAYTRRGTPCQREPVGDSEFCPSHRHLEHLYEEPAPAEQPAPTA